MFPPSYFPGVSPATVAAPASAVVFNSADAATQGNWSSVYGAAGYAIAGINPALPSYATLTLSGQNYYAWDNSSADRRALLDPTRAGNRLAACWYNNAPFGLTLGLADRRIHRVTAYFLDWDGGGSRAETVQVADPASGVTLDSRDLTGFQGGVYLLWYVQGNVTFRVIWKSAGVNAVLSGLFLD